MCESMCLTYYSLLLHDDAKSRRLGTWKVIHTWFWWAVVIGTIEGDISQYSVVMRSCTLDL